ncbi:MAG: hypothetical protein ACO3GP_02075 [Candidatus Limnocylindrus sp.]
MDPVSIIAAATTAYNAIKKGIEIGREIQDMGGQLATWAGAVSDIDFLERKAEDPPWYKAFSQSVQQEAIAIFAAKKQLEQQRNELRTYIQFSMGQSAWDELLRIEAKVRKQRADHEHRKAEIKEAIVSAVLILVMVTSVTGFLTIVAWLWMENNR